MNPKQLGLIIVILGILSLVQLGQSFQGKAKSLNGEADAAAQEEAGLSTQLEAERGVYEDLERQSKDLLGFVAKWEPFFAVIEEQQAAETGISMKVREANMLNLSQRYQQVPHKINNVANKSLPILMSASLVFDDSYAKLLNWVGTMEKIRPTMRIGRLVLTKGSRGEDLRMDVTLEVPLRSKAGKSKRLSRSPLWCCLGCRFARSKPSSAN
jgi:hypothetical protein